MIQFECHRGPRVIHPLVLFTFSIYLVSASKRKWDRARTTHAERVERRGRRAAVVDRVHAGKGFAACGL